MNHKKRKIKGSKNAVIFIILITTLIVVGILIFKKPNTTGNVVTGTETIYSENLNIKKNESGTYEWQVKNLGSIKSLKATGSVTSNGTARVYIEKNGTKYLLFDSTKQLFDVNVQVLPEYKKIFQGDEILIQITLLNLRGFGSGNVNVKYFIKDQKGNLIASEEETVFVETQAKIIRKLIIPAEIQPGSYLAFVEASTNIVVGTGSDSFEVKSKYENNYRPELKYYLIGFVVLVAIVILWIFSLYGVKKLKRRKKIAELKEKLPLERVEKLESELKSLKEARKAGLISEESYQKEKKRIENKLLIEKNPKHTPTYMLLALAYERKNQFKDAVETYRKILNYSPRFAPAANNLAWLIAEKVNGDLDEALRFAQIAKEILPKQSSVSDTLGWIHFKRKKPFKTLRPWPCVRSSLARII